VQGNKQEKARLRGKVSSKRKRGGVVEESSEDDSDVEVTASNVAPKSKARQTKGKKPAAKPTRQSGRGKGGA